MRTISPGQIAVFVFLASMASMMAFAAAWLIFPLLGWSGEFRPIIASLLFLVIMYAASIGCYRALCSISPFPVGDIPMGSRHEATYHIYLLFFLVFFYPLMKSNLVPVPLMRSIYLALGARLGHNTYSGGILFDPMLVDIGANTIVGQGAMLIPHIIEGERLAHFPIRIGDNVTIGANAIILADVEIGDNAIVAVASVVTKGTRIPPGEAWGGVPAKPLRRGP